MKKKRVELEQYSDDVYRVKRLYETVEYNVGDSLTKEEVQKLCDDPAWQVVIVKAR